MAERIDHAAEAAKQVENIVRFSDATELASYEESAHVQQWMANGLGIAQVHATLALVEQQRVANLIAVHERTESVDLASELWNTEIREALGLG